MSFEQKQNGEPCVRVKRVIDGENYYITVGQNFAHPTTPYENRPDNHKLRVIADAICDAITDAQTGPELAELVRKTREMATKNSVKMVG